MPLVTVVICTYNRVSLLEQCLQSLNDQSVNRTAFEVLVVDNYGADACCTATDAFGATYVHEPQTGLSHARNRAAREAKTDWIFYLDDDALAHNDMLAQFLHYAENPEVQVLGGRYEHYFATPPPKWLKTYYRASVSASNLPGLVLLPPERYLSGGIFGARRLLALAHPFRTDLGMKASQPGFGEENEWQDRLRAEGIAVHFSKHIAMDHLVQQHKQTVRDRIDLAYAHGQYLARTRAISEASRGVQKVNERAGFYRESLRILLKTAPYDLARVLFKPGFYWQNGVISTLGKLAFIRGKYGR